MGIARPTLAKKKGLTMQQSIAEKLAENLTETVKDINAVGSPNLRIKALVTLRHIVDAFNLALIEDLLNGDNIDPMNP